MATDVFISYSRKNKDFALQLVEALKASGHDVWIDLDAIPPSAEWWGAIKRGIDEANAFVVILTPESLSSPVCTFEMDYAIKNNKRIVPLMRNDAAKSQTFANIAAVEPTGFLAEILGEAELLDMARDNWRVVEKLNWINLRASDNFDVGLRNLLTVIEQDPKHVQEHTRLLVRAREWEANGRKAAYALRGEDLRDAEIWQAASAGKQPIPTDLHLEYIRASQKVRKDEQSRNRALTQARFGIVLAIALFAVVGLLFFNLRNGEQTSANATLAAQSTLSYDNLSTAVAAQSTSERRADEAQSLALGAAAEVESVRDNLALALPLALEANRIINPPVFSKNALASIAYKPGLRRIIYGGDQEQVDNVAFMPDGKSFLAASDDGTLILSDAVTGKTLRRFTGHDIRDDYFNVIASDAHTIASIPFNGGNVTLWDFNDPARMLVIQGQSRIDEAAFSPDGKRLVAYGDQAELALWDVATSTQLWRSSGYKGYVFSAVWSPDGTKIAVSISDIESTEGGSIILLDAATGSEVQQFIGDFFSAYSLDFDAGGYRLVSSGSGGDVILWDVQTGKEIRRYTGLSEGGGVWSIDISPDGQRVTGGSEFSDIIEWNLETGAVLQRYVGHSQEVKTLGYSPDGRFILSIASSYSDSAALYLWDAMNGAIQSHLSNLDAPNVSPKTLAISPDGRLVAYASYWRVFIVDSISGELRYTFESGFTYFTFTRVLFSSDSRFLVAVGNRGLTPAQQEAQSKWFVWDLQNKQLVHNQILATNMNDAALSPTDQLLYIAVNNTANAVEIWDIKSETKIGEFNVGKIGQFVVPIQELALSKDGHQLLISNGPETALWDIDSQTIRQSFGERQTLNYGAAISPDGLSIAIGDYDGGLILYDTSTGREIGRFFGHTASVDHISFSPDGNYIASGDRDGHIFLWNRHTGAEIRRLDEPTNMITGLVFSPDGSYLISSSDNDVFAWRIDTLDQLIQWTYTNRVVPTLSCSARNNYAIMPLCNIEGTPPVLTPYEIWTPSPTFTATSTPLPPTATPTSNLATQTAQAATDEAYRAATQTSSLLTATVVTYTPTMTPT